MMFSVGCHAVCKIFLVKSKLSTLMSSFLRLPPTQTLRGLRIARGLLLSRDASKVTSRLVLRSNIRKKLLYAPVMMTLGEKERVEGKKQRYNYRAACGRSANTNSSGQLSSGVWMSSGFSRERIKSWIFPPKVKFSPYQRLLLPSESIQ